MFLRRNKQYINYSLLEDGLHPGYLLSKKWLRKLQLDMIKETYQHSDTVSAVDPQELLAFQLENSKENPVEVTMKEAGEGATVE